MNQNPISDLISSYLHFVDTLCACNYEVGREAACSHLPKEYILKIILSSPVTEPQCLIAWKAGYDDQIAEFCNVTATS